MQSLVYNRDMNQAPKPVILITGASSGLGLILAKKLMAQSFHLVLTARDSSLPRFEEEGIVESENIWLRPLDIIDEDQRKNLILEINQRLSGVDILINNAGFTYRAVVEHVSAEERIKQLHTNFIAAMELSRLVLPFMRAKRAGKIINISSVGGMMAMPTMAIYSASKWALEGYSESLWYEVKPWNIKVTLIQPGFINSDSFKLVKHTIQSADSAKEEKDPYHNHYFYMANFIEKLMKLSPSKPENVADKIIKVIHHPSPPLRVAGTLDAVIFKLIRVFLPQKIYHRILYHSLPGIRHWGPENK